VFQGILTAKPDEFRKPIKFVELWLHESERVYGDRLVSYDDLKIYKKDAQAQVKRRFAQFNLSKYFAGEGSDPLIFCHDSEGVYDQVTSIQTLTNTMKAALKEYNETNATMDLVLFEDAVKHIARIMRIVLNPSGHALLVGVGGMGKQSLSKLAAHVCQYTTKSITLTSSYNTNDFKQDIAEGF
jgi:dynein heavy chain